MEKRRSTGETTYRILGIESSCDETAAAVVENGRRILSNVVASQAALHAQYGGVFPEAASRQHLLTFVPVIEQALRDAHVELAEVDAIAVTRGPGLPGSLVVGINVAKGLAMVSGKPLIGVHHLEAHLHSVLLSDAQVQGSEILYPAIGLIVSGGHTELVLISEPLRYQSLGATLDDAAGEAFDKVARLLKLPYPGGPSIQMVSAKGNPEAFSFPRAWLEGTWNFSFSGLKTAVLREVKRLERYGSGMPVEDLAASFQQAVVDVLVGKTLAAAEQFRAKCILIVGGVAANRALREAISLRAPTPVLIPPLYLCTDNAAMIAAAGYFRYRAGQSDGLDMDVLPNWPLAKSLQQF
ncbi:MAG: tRNA (adenosine(37)-N6)-threonylcarbamoyltransferase complex transferase subunit TsaD [Anaerolineales bacterium]|nr:tRNA (adenosine(37)-N6)-threonylcarbamoyltransferase complex transferase subunit TsaD [Anaerolineales bacterium]MDW8160735.1 tRNA (adenosine(37)-N6)-threonylcarbamoyltransferase complex transferase subunit TsaD [Anaerolineales bacterium]